MSEVEHVLAVNNKLAEPTDTFTTYLVPGGSASSAGDPVLFGGGGGNGNNLWNVVLNNGRKHRD